MLKFTVEHKYCKCTRTIIGGNVWEAFKNNKMDYSIWNIINVEQIKEY